jgi:molybdopterin-synthase adenylyltransferase
MSDVPERYSRQADLVPADRLNETLISIIGVGAIGRQVALQLAAIGAPRIRIFDHDIVEEGNLAAQGFLEADLGLQKVEAVRDMMERINSEIEVDAIAGKFKRGENMGQVCFCCVDSISTREFIWNALQEKPELWIDGRMSAETLRILCAFDKSSREFYPETIFAQSEAFQGSCTAKTTYYSSNIIAGLMVAQMAKWLRALPLQADIQFGLQDNNFQAMNVRQARKQAKLQEEIAASFTVQE